MGWEAEMLLWIQEYIRNPVITPWMQKITSLGNYGAVWLVLTAFFVSWETSFPMIQKRFAGIALRRKGIMSQKRPAAGGESCEAGFFFVCIKPMRKTGAVMFTAIALSFVVNNLLLKPWIGRIRPYEVIQGLTLLASRPSDASFPSGHTACAAAASLAFWMTAGKEGGKGRAFGICLFILAALIAWSRLYLGVHYPTDVAAGALSGGLMAWISAAYFHFPDS